MSVLLASVSCLMPRSGWVTVAVRFQPTGGNRRRPPKSRSDGQETTSLLISPEGWLINLVEIEDAEQGRLAEPPWCFVKTQFGPVEGHVALVELLAALQREFSPIPAWARPLRREAGPRPAPSRTRRRTCC